MIFIREYGVLICTILGLGVIVTAWNLESPSWWLPVTGWLLLVPAVANHKLSLPKNSPYPLALVLFGGSLFILCALSPSTARSMFQFIFQPLFDHLLNFLTNKGFLLATITYFASACSMFGTEPRKTEDERDRYREDAEELEGLKMARLEEILKDADD